MSKRRVPTIEVMAADRQTISIRQACALADVSPRTIYNWIASGKVEPATTGKLAGRSSSCNT